LAEAEYGTGFSEGLDLLTRTDGSWPGAARWLVLALAGTLGVDTLFVKRARRTALADRECS
jgi:hypothetical protein